MQIGYTSSVLTGNVLQTRYTSSVLTSNVLQTGYTSSVLTSNEQQTGYTSSVLTSNVLYSRQKRQAGSDPFKQAAVCRQIDINFARQAQRQKT
jgi:hypothetical protein